MTGEHRHSISGYHRNTMCDGCREVATRKRREQRTGRSDRSREQAEWEQQAEWEEARPCGTVAAYNRHLRRGEPTCGPCKAAVRAKKKAERDRRAGRLTLV